jgi:glutathione S-transferase
MAAFLIPPHHANDAPTFMTTDHYKLYHFPLDPHSRLARLALGEMKLDVEEVIIKYWEPSDSFIRLNASACLPVLQQTKADGAMVLACENRAIIEHLYEGGLELWSHEAAERCEGRRLLSWMERKFDFEVNAHLLFEKMEKRLFGRGAPDMAALKQGRENLKDHLRYFEQLLSERDWLAGKKLSFGDLACAAHLSVIDYFDEMTWSRYPQLKLWYMAIKSRPSFRALLADTLPGMPAATHYKDLDF